jgi:hypothetical protein
MLAIGKAVNFALAICHPLVLCHEITEAHGRSEDVGREGRHVWLSASAFALSHAKPDNPLPAKFCRNADRLKCAKDGQEESIIPLSKSVIDGPKESSRPTCSRILQTDG